MFFSVAWASSVRYSRRSTFLLTKKTNTDDVTFKCTHISPILVLKVREQHIRDGEVDDCGVFLHKEVVLGESLNAENEVWRKFGQLKPFEKILLVGFVFLQESKMHCDSLHF